MSQSESKVEADLKNNLKAIRTRLGISQGDLALAAGVARQTIGGIEASKYAPSAAVALKLARALGCRVEEIFWLDEPVQTVIASRAGSPASPVEDERMLVGQVGSRWVAHSLQGEAAFRSEMVPADGLATAKGASVEIRLLDSLESLSRTVLIAGCSPALSLWTRSAQRWHPGLRPAWIHANSSQALEALGRGEVHIAGMHLSDPDSDEDNAPFVRRFVPSGDVTLINFGVWEEGFLVRAGNPRQIKSVADLRDHGAGFINRDRGSGSRLLFDTLMQKQGLMGYLIKGYDVEEKSHQGVAKAISEGRADAGMGTAAMAQLFGLDFVPLRRVRFDFAVRSEFLTQEPVTQLFETLSHRSVRMQLEKLGGYDTGLTGEVVARL